jgi:hypothetical protein
MARVSSVSADASFRPGGRQTGRRPLTDHCALELARPLICIIIRPAGVAVSMFSVMERKPAPALATVP